MRSVKWLPRSNRTQENPILRFHRLNELEKQKNGCGMFSIIILWSKLQYFDLGSCTLRVWLIFDPQVQDTQSQDMTSSSKNESSQLSLNDMKINVILKERLDAAILSSNSRPIFWAIFWCINRFPCVQFKEYYYFNPNLESSDHIWAETDV